VGTLRQVGFPWDFSDTPASWRLPAPGLGQHTDALLGELGYSGDQIGQLRESGSVL